MFPTNCRWCRYGVRGLRGCLTQVSAHATSKTLSPRQAMANRVRILCRNISALIDRIASSRSSSPVECRSQLGTSAVQALRVSMMHHSMLCKSLRITIPIVPLVVLYHIATTHIHTELTIPLSVIAVLASVVIVAVIMHIVTSRSIIRQIKGDSLLELFESADDTMQREMCDELERLYHSNRKRLAKYDRVRLIAEPWSWCILPNSTEVQNALEDTLEAWMLSMNPAFRRYIQECIDELVVHEVDPTEEKGNARFQPQRPA